MDTRRNVLKHAAAGAMAIVANTIGQKTSQANDDVTSDGKQWYEMERILDAALLMACDGHTRTCLPCPPQIVHRLFPDGIRLRQLFEYAARENGWTGVSFSEDSVGCLEWALPSYDARMKRFYRLDFAGLLTRSINRIIMHGFMMADQSWRSVASIESVNDFSTVSVYKEECGIPHDRAFTPREREDSVDSYGMLFGIPAAAFDRDDISSITNVASNIGRKAGDKVSDAVWTKTRGCGRVRAGFLYGQQAPTIDMVCAEPESSRVICRGFHDFGVYYNDH